MRNVIDACKQHGSALVLFDSVYAYGLLTGEMTEDRRTGRQVQTSRLLRIHHLNATARRRW
jgi:hypothetical protein